eukprot:10016143-Lingulodinium_polyedra.AAC.1
MSSSVAGRGRSNCAVRPRVCRWWPARAIAVGRAIAAARPVRVKPGARSGGEGRAGRVPRLRAGRQAQHARMAG